MSNPYESPNFDTYSSGGQYPAPKGAVPSGMVQQVRVVAILNTVQGGLEVMMGVMLIIAGVMMISMADNPEFRRAMEQQPNAASEEFMKYMWIGYAAVGVVVLLAGVFRVVAGIRNWSFRGRTMGIISFAVGLLSAVGCYCAPTGIAVLVYGLIVYLNPSVSQAFAMGAEGVPGDRILYEFSPYRHSES